MNRPVLILILSLVISLAFAQEVSPDELCRDLLVVAENVHVRVSNVQAYRGPFDFAGTRFVGCLTNRSDQTIVSAIINYDYVLERGGGGGSESLDFAEIPPGETRPFISSLQRRDSTGSLVSGLVLRELELGFSRGEAKPSPLQQLAELPFEQLPLPEHPLASLCESGGAAEEQLGAYALRLSALSFYRAPFTPGAYYVVGCLTAFEETALERAEDGTVSVPASMSATLVDESGSVAFASRSGALVTRDLELNTPAPFASSFTVDERFPAVTLELFGYDVVDGAFVMVALAPAAYLVHPGREDEAAAASLPADDWDMPWTAPAPSEPIAFMPFAPAPFAAALEVGSLDGPLGELRVNVTPEGLRAEFWDFGAGGVDPEVLVFTQSETGEGFSLLVINTSREDYEIIPLEEEYLGLHDLFLLLSAPDFSAHPCVQLDWACILTGTELTEGRSTEVWTLKEPGEIGHITVWVDEELRIPLRYSDPRDVFVFFTESRLLELEPGSQAEGLFEIPAGYTRY